jgi:hypothetical protein
LKIPIIKKAGGMAQGESLEFKPQYHKKKKKKKIKKVVGPVSKKVTGTVDGFGNLRSMAFHLKRPPWIPILPFFKPKLAKVKEENDWPKATQLRKDIVFKPTTSFPALW